MVYLLIKQRFFSWFVSKNTVAVVHNAFNCRTCTSNTKIPCKIWKRHSSAPFLLLPVVSLQSPQESPMAALVAPHPLATSEETLSSLVASAVSIPSRLPIVSLARHRTGRMPERYCCFHKDLPAVPCFIPFRSIRCTRSLLPSSEAAPPWLISFRFAVAVLDS